MLLMILSVFSDKLSQFSVALGVVGAGVAFAMQEIIVSVGGWIGITFGHYFKVGDRIKLGGIVGDVIDIGVLRTTIMECGEWVNADLYNGRIVRIANSFLFKEPVFNYSGDFPFVWDEITIPVKYGSDYNLANEIFHKVGEEVTGEYAKFSKIHWEEMVKKFMIENARVDLAVSMIANDNWVEYTLRYVVDYKERRITKTKLFSRILQEIEKVPDDITLASATFEVVGIPKIKVERE